MIDCLREYKMKCKMTILAMTCAMTTSSFAENMDDLAKRFTFIGIMEIEASYTDSTEWGDDDSSSDLILATAQLGVNVALVDNVSLHFVSLYKQGDIDFDMHEGYIQLQNTGGEGINLKLGKIYLPFGQLKTNLVNDTLGLELVSPAESIGFRESAALMGWSADNLSIEGYAFNGDDDDEMSGFGVSFGYGNEALDIGVDYLSNVAGSVMIGDALEESQGVAPNGDISAVSINGMAQWGAATLLAEYIQIDDLDKIGFLSDDAPSFSQLDLGYDLGNGWRLAAAYQLTDESAILSMPESRITAGVATSIFDDVVAVSLELWHDQDYCEGDGGSGEVFNGLVLQIASEF